MGAATQIHTPAGNLIGDHWVTADRTYMRRSPLDGDELGPYPDSGTSEVDAAVDAARQALPRWRSTAPPARGGTLHRVAALVERHREELAQAITQEEGKRLTEARGEVDYAVRLLRFFAELVVTEGGSVLAGAEPAAVDLARRRPLGVIALIAPWNFPLLVPIRKLAPALAFGNTVVLKPSEESPATAALLAAMLHGNGVLPPGVVNLVFGGARAGEALVAHEGIDAISFTGSTATGRTVQAAAVQRPRPIPVQAEMGGKNVLVVSDDADVELAVKIAMDGVLKGSGQRCTCTGLVLVSRRCHDEFVHAVADSVRNVRVGPGAEESTEVSPLISATQRERALQVLNASVDSGACVQATATLPESPGWYVAPAVITGVTADMPIATEEIFAPVIPIASFDRDEEAIAWINSLPYGLSASIVTDSIQRALQFVEEVDAGIVKVNQETGSAEPQFPFGGWKDSAAGPHEQGVAAAEFYTRRQTVHLVPGMRRARG